MQACLITKDYPELAVAEIAALSGKHPKQYDDIVTINANTKKLERLACTRTIYEVISITANPEKAIKRLNWNKIIKKDFLVRSNKTQLNKKLGSLIFRQLKNPKVNVKNPATVLFFYFHKKKVFILKQKKILSQNFEARKAHKRKKLIPIGMHPKLARAMVNLLNAKTVTDPFCGTGGILIEAALMKLNPIGYDIDERMIKATKENLKQLNLKAKVKQADATKIKAKYIATELPFAKNTKPQNLTKLYTAFLINAKKNKAKIAASLPTNINYKKIIKQSGYKIKHETKVYLHKSLSKVILLLD